MKKQIRGEEWEGRGDEGETRVTYQSHMSRTWGTPPRYRAVLLLYISTKSTCT